MMNDPQIVSAMISAFATIMAALIAAGIAAYFGKRIAGREKAEAERDAAIQDIHFLLAVEDRHCELHRESDRESNKIRARKHVTENTSLRWSGRFTPGRVKG